MLLEETDYLQPMHSDEDDEFNQGKCELDDEYQSPRFHNPSNFLSESASRQNILAQIKQKSIHNQPSE